MSTNACRYSHWDNADNVVIPGTLTVGGVAISGGLLATNVAAIGEGANKTGTKNATTHLTFDAQVLTGTDITAPDNKTFQINSAGIYSIVAYAIITPATSDAGMRQLKLVGSGTGNAEFHVLGATATWTPDGVSNGTSKRIKLTFALTTYMESTDTIALDFENRDATNDTPVFDCVLAVKKLG